MKMLRRLRVQAPDAFYAEFRASAAISSFVKSYYAEDFMLYAEASARTKAREAARDRLPSAPAADEPGPTAPHQVFGRRKVRTEGSPMNLGKGLGGAVTAVTGVFGRAANQIIALVVTLLAARWLTPVSFGEYAIAVALVTLSRQLLYAGAFEYLLKTPHGDEAATECLVIN